MPSDRNLDPDVWLQHVYDAGLRRLSFTEAHAENFTKWRDEFVRTLAAGMGGMPQCDAPLKPEITDTYAEDGYTRHRLLLQAEPMMDIPCWLLIPEGIEPGEERPAILALHGHGAGKDDIVGLDNGDQDRASLIRTLNYDYARQFAQRGYVVIAPDHRGFGERTGGKETVAPRDYCNLLMLKQALFGRNALMSNVYDATRCIDYLQTREDVDGQRIGAVGLSYGGTMALFTTALEPRVKVACVSCYMNSFRKYALEMFNFCGNQTPSGLLEFGEMWDVAISIAPRPLVLESGINDPGFPFEQSHYANKQVKTAYEACGYGDRIAVDEFEGEHEFSGRITFDWFDKWL